MTALAFTLLRSYVLKKDLLHENISKNSHIKIKKKNIFALVLYFNGGFDKYDFCIYFFCIASDCACHVLYS